MYTPLDYCFLLQPGVLHRLLENRYVMVLEEV